jgi:hypothetical protein
LKEDNCCSFTGWLKKKGVPVIGGQCLEYFQPLLQGDGLYDKFYRFWVMYHLNDVNGATVNQVLALGDGEYFRGKLILRNYTFDAIREMLTAKSMWIDDGYTYGDKWLTHPIPEEDLNIMLALLEGRENDVVSEISPPHVQRVKG